MGRANTGARAWGRANTRARAWVGLTLGARARGRADTRARTRARAIANTGFLLGLRPASRMLGLRLVIPQRFSTPTPPISCVTLETSI